MPPGNPEYALKRVWLTREEEQGYYYGLSNEGLWPLCHIAHTRPIFRGDDWDTYVRVNQRFADAFVEEMKAPGRSHSFKITISRFCPRCFAVDGLMR